MQTASGGGSSLLAAAAGVESGTCMGRSTPALPVGAACLTAAACAACRPTATATAAACSYMEGGRIAFSGTPEEMRRYMRRLGALI